MICPSSFNRSHGLGLRRERERERERENPTLIRTPAAGR